MVAQDRRSIGKMLTCAGPIAVTVASTDAVTAAYADWNMFGLATRTLASIDPSVEHNNADAADAAVDDRSPCLCYGGRMTIVESFRRGVEPRAPPPQARSGTAMS